MPGSMMDGKFLKMIPRLLAIKWIFMLLLTSAVGMVFDCAFAAETFTQPAATREAAAQPADIEVFVREGCPHCVKAEEFLAKLICNDPS